LLAQRVRAVREAAQHPFHGGAGALRAQTRGRNRPMMSAKQATMPLGSAVAFSLDRRRAS